MYQYVLDGDGEPQKCDDLLEWAKWMTASVAGDGRRVARTWVSQEVKVSTVFLAIDRGFTGNAPVLWETMVFGGELDEETERYASRADAEAGHARMVERVMLASVERAVDLD